MPSNGQFEYEADWDDAIPFIGTGLTDSNWQEIVSDLHERD